MRGKLIMYIDQYGHQYWVRTVRELSEIIGSKHVDKMYCEYKNKPDAHIGYVIRGRWCRAFIPYEGPR